MKTTNYNVSAFIESIVEVVNSVLVCFYDRAPDTESYPFAVLSGVTASDLAAGDLIMFDIDIWHDDKQSDATAAVEGYCDALRRELHNRIISREGVFAGHIGYENRDTSDDKETDLIHRRLSFSARIFYL